MLKLIHEYTGSRVRRGGCVNRQFDTDDPLRPHVLLERCGIRTGKTDFIVYRDADDKLIYFECQVKKIVRRRDGLYLTSLNKDFNVYRYTVAGQTYEEHIAQGVYERTYKRRAKKITFPLRLKKSRKQRAAYAWVQSCRYFWVREYVFGLMEVRPMIWDMDPDERKLVIFPVPMPDEFGNAP